MKILLQDRERNEKKKKERGLKLTRGKKDGQTIGMKLKTT